MFAGWRTRWNGPPSIFMPTAIPIWMNCLSTIRLMTIRKEQFRRRFINETFGGALPNQFDPRTYAFRQGFQKLVASPSDVIADDLATIELRAAPDVGKPNAGLPGRERIVDLFQFDLDLLLFPEADRDNFGETLGPATYDVQYNVGDRVTLLSDGYFDFFDDGLRSISAGVAHQSSGTG